MPERIGRTGLPPYADLLTFARDERGMGLRFLEMPESVEKQLWELCENTMK